MVCLGRRPRAGGEVTFVSEVVIPGCLVSADCSSQLARPRGRFRAVLGETVSSGSSVVHYKGKETTSTSLPWVWEVPGRGSLTSSPGTATQCAVSQPGYLERSGGLDAVWASRVFCGRGSAAMVAIDFKWAN